MNSGTKAFLNFAFFAAAVVGAGMIVYSDYVTGEYSMFYPTAAVVVFAAVVAIAQRDCDDIETAEYYSEAIYFLGFLFTLVSLAVLFYRLGSGGFSVQSAADAAIVTDGGVEPSSIPENLTATELMSLSTEAIENTFRYIGIAVTTTIAGVLLRNVVKAQFLKDYKPPKEDAQRSFELLKDIADTIGVGFNESIGAIGKYFEERKDLAEDMRQRETDYLQGLDAFARESTRFSETLSEVGSSLSREGNQLSTVVRQQGDLFNQSLDEVRQSVQQISILKRELGDLQISSLAADLQDLGERTREFNSVLDSMIEIVQRKADQLRRAR